MSLATSVPSRATRVRTTPADAAVRAFAWLGRLFLVLLLVVDQIGAPLHAHHHDFGIDGLQFAAVHDANIADDLHVECHSESGGHSVLALRVETRTAVATPEDEDTQATFVALLLSEAASPMDTRPLAR